MKKHIVVLFLFTSLLGIVDASYLTWKHYYEPLAPCSVGGCEVVLTSKYSEIAGFPTAGLGTIYYLSIFVITVLFLFFKKEKIITLLSKFTFVGFLTSVFLIYIQLFDLRSICPYCMFSAVISTVLFLVGMNYIYYAKIEEE